MNIIAEDLIQMILNYRKECLIKRIPCEPIVLQPFEKEALRSYFDEHRIKSLREYADRDDPVWNNFLKMDKLFGIELKEILCYRL